MIIELYYISIMAYPFFYRNRTLEHVYCHYTIMLSSRYVKTIFSMVVCRVSMNRKMIISNKKLMERPLDLLPFVRTSHLVVLEMKTCDHQSQQCHDSYLIVNRC